MTTRYATTDIAVARSTTGATHWAKDAITMCNQVVMANWTLSAGSGGWDCYTETDERGSVAPSDAVSCKTCRRWAIAACAFDTPQTP